MVLAIYTIRIAEKNHINQDQDIQAMAIISEEVTQVPATKAYTKYGVELSIDKDCVFYEGICKILYTHQSNRPTEEIVLNSGLINIKEIQINSAVVPFEQQELTTLIKSSFEIEKDAEMTITVQFTGRLNSSDSKGEKMAFACNFLPTISEYKTEDLGNLGGQEPGDYTITIHTHKGQYPIATGTMDGVSEKDSIITTSFSAKGVRDLGLFIGGPMEREVFNTQEGYSIVLYYIPDSGFSKETIDMITKSLRSYSEILGQYPYDQLTVIHKPGTSSGVTYPRMILGDFAKDHGVYIEINKLVGKQWLGYIIGTKKADSWFSEGLLTYLNKRFSFSQGQMESYIEEQKIREEKQKTQDCQDADNPYTCNDLAVGMFYEIEQAIGEEVFKEVLRGYYKEYSFQLATDQEFIKLVEEIAQVDIRYIYDDWLHKIKVKESE